MKKSEMQDLARKLKIDISDLLEPYEGKRGRIPESLIIAVKGRLGETNIAQKLDKVVIEPEKILKKSYSKSNFSEGQKLEQVGYGLGKESVNPVVFMNDEDGGKAKVRRDGIVAIVDLRTLRAKCE